MKDLSSYGIYSIGGSDLGVLSSTTIKVNGSTVEQIVYVDKVIITTNEPEN